MRYLVGALALLVPTVQAQEGLQTRGPVELSLRRAIEIATAPEGNAQVELAAEATRQAEARSGQARAALLPNVDASISQQSLTRNIAAFGVRFTIPGTPFAPPEFVGPFNVFDIRATGTQTVFDLSAWRRLRSARTGVSASRAAEQAAADQVALAVARAYVGALRAQADVETAEANVTLAAALLKQAESLKDAGTGTGVEVTRARVQLANEQQRRLVARNEHKRTRLLLLRAMGARLDTALTLAERLSADEEEAAVLERAASKALLVRADLRAQRQREQAALEASRAVALERIPSLHLLGDYGSIGGSINSALPTRTFGAALRVPLFDGGRRDARRAEAASQYRAERRRTRDIEEQIELDVELALDALRTAREEVQVADGGVGLAEMELEQARRRYEAGVATSLEVTEAQTRLSRARDNQTAALFHHAHARLELAHASGAMRQTVR
ncbi:MAG: TolC family protein [Bryobacterales bacterium]|nr:TolC family protein [Bryobacterales bacterium]